MAENVTTPEPSGIPVQEPVTEKEGFDMAQATVPAEAPPESSEQGMEAPGSSGSVVMLDRTSMPDAYNSKRDIACHELKTSQIRGRTLTGTLVSTERHKIRDRNVYVSIVDYQGYRVLIPTKEMNISVDGNDENRINVVVQNMIGCGIDFIVTQLDEESGIVGASRKRAMKKKIEDFYKTPSEATGMPIIQKGSVVEARIVAVSRKVLRLEVFGAECFTNIYDIDPAWIENARNKFSVGDTVNVRMKEIEFIPAGDGQEEQVRISVEGVNLRNANSYKCTPQSRYLGTVTAFSKGVYFLRLNVGANAIAHMVAESCRPFPREGDLISFVCTKLDPERDTAVGLITRVVRPARRDRS